MNFTYDLVLGMPHTNRRGLWEPTLLKYAGHFQWQAIAAAIGRPLSTLRSIGGGEVYAAFYFTELRATDTAPLESFKVDDVVRLSIALRAFKNISIEGLTRVQRAGAADSMDAPVIRSANIFMSPVSGNTQLKVTPPAGVDCATIPPLPNSENPYHLTRAGREEGALQLFTDPWRIAGDPFTSAYAIDRDRDTNGAGLVYFANYIAITDAAERALGMATGEQSIRERRTAYYGNADPDDHLAVRTTVFTNTAQPSRIGYRHTVARQSDASLICITEAIKATEHAVDLR